LPATLLPHIFGVPGETLWQSILPDYTLKLHRQDLSVSCPTPTWSGSILGPTRSICTADLRHHLDVAPRLSIIYLAKGSGTSEFVSEHTSYLDIVFCWQLVNSGSPILTYNPIRYDVHGFRQPFNEFANHLGYELENRFYHHSYGFYGT
jgi:hypothetical protein